MLVDTNRLLPGSVLAAQQIHRISSNKFVSDNQKNLRAKTSKRCLGVMCESVMKHYFDKSSELNGLIHSRHTNFIAYTNNVFFEELAPKLSLQDIS